MPRRKDESLLFAFPRMYGSLENRVHNFNVFACLRISFSFSLSPSFSLSSSTLSVLSFCSFIIRERDESSDRMKARLFAPGNKNYHVRHKPLRLSLFSHYPLRTFSTSTNPRRLITFAPLRERTKPRCIGLIRFISLPDFHS